MIDNRKTTVLKVQAQEGVLETIGSTPLIRLRRYLGSSDVALFAKMECYNPGGSAKDRPSRAMIEEALSLLQAIWGSVWLRSVGITGSPLSAWWMCGLNLKISQL